MSAPQDLNLNIDPILLKPLFKTKPYIHTVSMIFDWAIIFISIKLCLLFPSVFTYFLAVLIIGARMHALAILNHDATHYRFLKNRKWNDGLTNYFTMYPIFTSIEKYRKNHLRHHTHLNTTDDPDWIAKLGKRTFTFPKTKSDFLITLASYLLLYPGILDAIWFLKRFGGNDKNEKPSTSKRIFHLGFYVILFSLLTFFGVWLHYIFFWVIPYFSTFFMFQYIRSVAEHYGELEYENDLSSSRTVKSSLFEQFLIAPHNVGYHLEHHLYPAVPFYNLPKLHALLMTQPEFKNKAHITQGYTKGLLQELGGAAETINI